ncbi:MAG: sugar kinase [Beijerinckiaceae bacterium]
MISAASLDSLTTIAPTTRVVCVGLSALDVVWRVRTLFGGGGEKIRGVDHATMGGGMAATAAVTVARLGGQAVFWGRAGADAAGEQMHALLAGEGVDIGSFRLFPQGRSSVSGIIVDETGERQIVNFRGSFPEEADWLPLNGVTKVSAALADPRWVPGAAALFNAARASAVPTVLDADVAEAEVFETLLPLTDHAIFSAPALARFLPTSHEDALAIIAEYGCRVAAVTRGAEGVFWRERGMLHHQPACAISVVDTTGAGDVFHGAYALAIGAGLAAHDAIAFATSAAALKCTRPGGRAGIPTLDECLTFARANL